MCCARNCLTSIHGLRANPLMPPQIDFSLTMSRIPPLKRPFKSAITQSRSGMYMTRLDSILLVGQLAGWLARFHCLPVVRGMVTETSRMWFFQWCQRNFTHALWARISKSCGKHIFDFWPPSQLAPSGSLAVTFPLPVIAKRCWRAALYNVSG